MEPLWLLLFPSAGEATAAGFTAAGIEAAHRSRRCSFRFHCHDHYRRGRPLQSVAASAATGAQPGSEELCATTRKKDSLPLPTPLRHPDQTQPAEPVALQLSFCGIFASAQRVFKIFLESCLLARTILPKKCPKSQSLSKVSRISIYIGIGSRSLDPSLSTSALNGRMQQSSCTAGGQSVAARHCTDGHERRCIVGGRTGPPIAPYAVSRLSGALVGKSAPRRASRGELMLFLDITP